jgi:hypothetical protein
MLMVSQNAVHHQNIFKVKNKFRPQIIAWSYGSEINLQ